MSNSVEKQFKEGVAVVLKDPKSLCCSANRTYIVAWTEPNGTVHMRDSNYGQGHQSLSQQIERGIPRESYYQIHQDDLRLALPHENNGSKELAT